MGPDSLPRLIDCRGLMDELGVKRGVAEAIMRQLPRIPLNRRVFVRRDDVRRYLDERTIRPPPAAVAAPTDALPKLVDAADLCRTLGVSSATAWAMLRQPTVSVVLLVGVRRSYTRSDSLDAFLTDFAYDRDEPRHNLGRHAPWRIELEAALDRLGERV